MTLSRGEVFEGSFRRLHYLSKLQGKEGGCRWLYGVTSCRTKSVLVWWSLVGHFNEAERHLDPFQVWSHLIGG